MRFAFGKNWKHFLQLLSADRIRSAETSLQQLLECESLSGRSFLDIGCGSGLFSLAARRLGATVHSFDDDPESVDCCRELRQRYFPSDADWTIERGSIVDRNYLPTLAPADVVYAWGVLHHTNALWDAIENAAALVKPAGRFVVSIYNDQGGASRRWTTVKKLYNRLPAPLALLLVLLVGGWMELRLWTIASLRLLIRVVTLQKPWVQRPSQAPARGMSHWHDLVDWIGGYPFEVARPEQVFDFCRRRGFELTRMTTQGCGYGCNEFVFARR